MPSVGLLSAIAYYSGGSYQNITGVKNIKTHSPTAGTIDTGDLSVSDFYRTFMPGLIDAGEISFRLKYDKTQYDTLLDLFNAHTAQNWRITLSDSSTLIGSAFISKVGEIEADYDGSDNTLLEHELTVKYAGKPTFTAAS